MASLKVGMPLAMMQVAQVASGIAGQAVLLARWTPHRETDSFLIVAGGATLISTLMLVGGFELALPAAIHSRNPAEVQAFLREISGIAWIAGIVGMLISIGVVTLWIAVDTQLSGTLSSGERTWMALLLGGQVLPLTLASLGRGILIARNHLVQMRLTTLLPSLLTTAGYAFLPGSPAITLPFVLSTSTLAGAGLALYFCREKAIWTPRLRSTGLRQMVPLFRAMVALALAGGLVQLQTLVERLAVLPLGVGYVTAMSAAGRGWEAVTGVIVAACVMPYYPIWSQRDVETTGLLRQSLRWVWLFTLLIALGMGVGLPLLFPILANRSAGLAFGALLALILLPRSVLLIGLQPLSLRFHARGQSWQPLIASGLSFTVLLIGFAALIPGYGLAGFAAATTVSVLIGSLYLGWRTCVS